MTETRRLSTAGIAITRYPQPVVAYFLDYVDEDGSSCCVWDGETYVDALLAANDWIVEGIPVRDHTDDRRLA